MLQSTVCQRVAFAESARGRTVLEIDPDSAASKEIQSLAKEVLKLTVMTGKTKKKKVDFSVRPRPSREALPADAGPVGAGREGGGGCMRRPQGRKRLTLNLPAGMHTAFKGRCVLEGVTIQDKVTALIERELATELAAAGQGPQPL